MNTNTIEYMSWITPSLKRHIENYNIFIDHTSIIYVSTLTIRRVLHHHILVFFLREDERYWQVEHAEVSIIFPFSERSTFRL